MVRGFVGQHEIARQIALSPVGLNRVKVTRVEKNPPLVGILAAQCRRRSALLLHKGVRRGEQPNGAAFKRDYVSKSVENRARVGVEGPSEATFLRQEAAKILRETPATGH
jgi:hypothetical protein